MRSPEEIAFLTPAEMAAIRLVCDGHTNKSGADVMGISFKTFGHHRCAAMTKLRTQCSVDLLRCAVLNGIVVISDNYS